MRLAQLERVVGNEESTVVSSKCNVTENRIGLPVLHTYNSYLRVLALRKYRRPCSRPHLIDHIFGARITLILLFASLFY